VNNKELENRIETIEKELDLLKEKNNEESSNFIINLIHQYSKKNIFLFSLALFVLIVIISFAGTVTKNYTFTDGELASAAKFNANFDTLFNLVNGNLDDSNISGISASKIKGVISSNQISYSNQDNKSIYFFSTNDFFNGNLGGRVGADQKCRDSIGIWVTTIKSSCNNVRALLSVGEDDEVRDMKMNYSIPEDYSLRSSNGMWFAKSWDNFTSDTFLTAGPGIPLFYDTNQGGPFESGFSFNVDHPWGFWYSTANNTSPKLGIADKHCTNWTSSEESNDGFVGITLNFQYMNTPAYYENMAESYSYMYQGRGHLSKEVSCSLKRPLLCICW
jgi:hypothetical protein